MLNIKNTFLYSLYTNICISLFEKDKLLLSFSMAIKLLEFEKQLDETEYRFLLTGGVSAGEEYDEKPAAWVVDNTWAMLNRCAALPAFDGLVANFVEKIDDWKTIYDSSTPQDMTFPFPLAEGVKGELQKLILLRILRFDKLIPGMINFISSYMDKKFADPPPA